MNQFDLQKLHEQDMEDEYNLEKSVISTMECTGMVQAPPQSEYEADNFKDIYDISISKEEKHQKSTK